MDFLNPFASYIRIGKIVAIMLFAAWAFRVDHLRSVHEKQLSDVAAAFKKAGYNDSGYNHLAVNVKLLSTEAQISKDNWARADAAVSDLNFKITIMGQQEQQAKATGEAAQRAAEAATADRDVWIKKAMDASKRVGRLSDNQELDACTAAMDSLYTENF